MCGLCTLKTFEWHCLEILECIFYKAVWVYPLLNPVGTPDHTRPHSPMSWDVVWMNVPSTGLAFTGSGQCRNASTAVWFAHQSLGTSWLDNTHHSAVVHPIGFLLLFFSQSEVRPTQRRSRTVLLLISQWDSRGAQRAKAKLTLSWVAFVTWL